MQISGGWLAGWVRFRMFPRARARIHIHNFVRDDPEIKKTGLTGLEEADGNANANYDRDHVRNAC